MTEKTITAQEFSRLFIRYRDRFVSVAMSYIRDEVVAEDIVAESFTNFWDNRDIFLSSRFENLTYNEIAEKYSITPRKVKREIQHVLEIMRTSLKDYLPLLILLYVISGKLN